MDSMDDGLKLYNTLSKEKEKFVPLDGNNVTIYVCGPTAFETEGPTLHYAREAVLFDTFKNYLKELGFNIHSAMNITDYNVKIVEKADKMEKSPSEVIEESVTKYFEDMKRLKVDDYDEYPRATEHISGIISLVKDLLDKGFAYKTVNAIYFDISAFEDKKQQPYGILSGKARKMEDIKQKEGLSGADEKQDPRDFLLWKFEDENGENAKHKDLWYDAPELGDGRKGGPGWHSECIVMINYTFGGREIDIHGGRTDHIRIHHENELVQSKAAFDRDLANFWMHVGRANYEGKDGWGISVRQMMEENGIDPSIVRYEFLRNNYNGDLKINKSTIEEAHNRVSKIREVANKTTELQENASTKERDNYVKKLIDDANKRFKDSMNDSLNTVAAIHSINDTTKELSKVDLLSKLGKEDLDEIVKYYDNVNKILKIF